MFISSGIRLALLVVCVSLTLQIQDAIRCYACANVSSVSECKQSITCAKAGVKCRLEYLTSSNGKHFTLGCGDAGGGCVKSSLTSPGSLVGRSSSVDNCTDCCNTDNCNRQLCQQHDPSCVDATDFDCSSIGATLDICEEPQRARTYCRNFCGLCSLRDGSWTTWSSWINCDASCGNGTQSRTRTCTNPPPTNGGNYCVGSASEVQTCSLKACPVHGGWAQWSPWGSCTMSCGVGLQRRDRSCSRPYPSADGSFCYGDSRDDRLCIMNGCTDGEWSPWGLWSSCTKPCGEGVRTRSRICNNPRPSIMGRFCIGDSLGVDKCNLKRCTDGVAFMAYRTNTTHLGQHAVIVYNEVKLNIGSNYNSSTGIFLSPLSGIYSFSIFACAKSNAYFILKLLVNAKIVDNLLASDNLWSDCVSRSFIVSLIAGDRVFVKLASHDQFTYQFGNMAVPSFAGFLIQLN